MEDFVLKTPHPSADVQFPTLSQLLVQLWEALLVACIEFGVPSFPALAMAGI